MNYAKYSDLKGKSKQAFKKIAASGGDPEYIVIETKRYDYNTGEEQTASSKTITLVELESDKARYTAEKALAQAQITELNKMITDIKAL